MSIDPSDPYQRNSNTEFKHDSSIIAGPLTGPSLSIDFCTLGMFIIDEIHFAPPTPPVKDIPGGAGSYSALGARILSPPPLSHSVGWIVDCGSDFPSSLRSTLSRWQTSCLFRSTPSRLTTRAWNSYASGGTHEHRAFKYLTPKLRLDHSALTPALLRSKSFHLICSPTRCVDLVTNILSKRSQIPPSSSTGNAPLDPPLFIWEPVPDLCVPSELENCKTALQIVDVVSPNHAELAAFFGSSGLCEDGAIDRASIAEFAAHFASWMTNPTHTALRRSPAVVVRAGKEGCYVLSHNKDDSGWLPAYYSHSAEKVVDPTGGGNTFLGAMSVALARGKGSRAAAIWGSVAASFAIEQVGMPELRYGGKHGEEGDEREHDDEAETWNQVRVKDRVEEYMKCIDRGWKS